jgi:hypothetical protein
VRYITFYLISTKYIYLFQILPSCSLLKNGSATWRFSSIAGHQHFNINRCPATFHSDSTPRRLCVPLHNQVLVGPQRRTPCVGLQREVQLEPTVLAALGHRWSCVKQRRNQVPAVLGRRLDLVVNGRRKRTHVQTGCRRQDRVPAMPRPALFAYGRRKQTGIQTETIQTWTTEASVTSRHRCAILEKMASLILALLLTRRMLQI